MSAAFAYILPTQSIAAELRECNDTLRQQAEQKAAQMVMQDKQISELQKDNDNMRDAYKKSQAVHADAQKTMQMIIDDSVVERNGLELRVNIAEVRSMSNCTNLP